MPGSRFNTNVFVQELFSGEVVHEVLRCHVSSLLLSILGKDLVKTLEDGLHEAVKSIMHGLVLFAEGSDLFAELLVNLFDDSVQPVAHVRVSEFDLLCHFRRLFMQFLSRLDLNVKLVDLRVGRATTTLVDFDAL